MAEYPVRWITQDIAVGYAPRSQADLEAVKAQGISAIVNLCAECYDLHEIEEKGGFHVYHLPIMDEGAPESAGMEKALAWLAEMTGAGRKVLVHCRFGIGRTGTFVTAYLFQKGYSLEEALEKLGHTPSRPSSREQWEFLEQWGRKWGMREKTAVDREKEASPTGTFFKKWEAMMRWLGPGHDT